MKSPEQPAPIDAAAIDQVIDSGFRLLRFPPAVEAVFEAETSGERCRQLILRGMLALILYNLFLLSDYVLMPDVFAFAVGMRLGFVTPMSLLIILVLLRNPPPWLREGMEAFATVVATGSVVVIMLASTSVYRVDAHFGLVLCIMFATIIQRIRFWYAVAGVLGAQAFYVYGVTGLTELHQGQLISANLVFGGAVLFSLIGSYNLEREQRLGYLLSYRDRILHAELEGLSRHDSLTGLLNRRALDQSFQRLASAPDSRPVGVLLLDIDHFKAFNDAAGHQAGDVCLQRIAGVIDDVVRRRSDVTFRYGGEEFLVLLHEAESTVACLVGERIRAAVAAAAIPHPAFEGGRVTISVGCSAGRVRGQSDADRIVAEADAALYEAKRCGRNTVFPRFQEVVEFDDLEFREPLDLVEPMAVRGAAE